MRITPNMDKKTGILIDAPFPLIWMANYPISQKSLIIPSCLSCGELAREKCACGGTEFGIGKIVDFDENNPGVITEYDAEGQETIPFDLLPREDLVYFSLVDPCVNPTRFYTFDLRTGRLLVNQMPLGLAITTPSEHGRNLGYVSDSNFVGKKIELFHSKHVEMSLSGKIKTEKNEFDEIMAALDMGEEASTITNIVAGYSYEFSVATTSSPRLVAEARLSVDCQTHVPYITARIYPDGDPLDETN